MHHGADLPTSALAATGSALSATSMASIDAATASRIRAQHTPQRAGDHNADGRAQQAGDEEGSSGSTNGSGAGQQAATATAVVPTDTAGATAVAPVPARAPVPAAPAADNPDALFLARVGSKLAGWVVGLGTAAFLIFYQ